MKIVSTMPAQNHLRVGTLNVRGVSDFTNAMSLVREMKRRNVDVLLLQEHNVKAAKIPNLVANLSRAGICSAWSCSTTKDERGGTAVLIRENVAVEPQILIDHKRGNSLDGGLCMIEVKIGSDRVRLASIYLPAKPSIRKSIISELTELKLISNNTILGGDMNCVPDPTLDMKSLDGCREADKQNTGGPELEKMLTAAGLEDVYRRFNGTKREYTWFSETVYKRHDRIYVQSYQSEMRWVSAAPDHTFFRATNARSDHLAMIATAEWGNPTETMPKRRTIDTKVLFENETKEFIPTLLHSCYVKYPPDKHGQSKPFDLFKKLAFDYLINQTMLSKKPSVVTEIESELAIKYSAIQDYPHPKAMSKIIELERKLTDALKEKRKNAWFAFDRAAQAEMSTKKFYKKFRNKHSTHEITSLHTTDSWTFPDLKSGVAKSHTQILGELTKYYKWLFTEKPSKGADRLLQLLSDNPIPSRLANSAEKAISLPEVEVAIDKLALGKSPGPDGLPAEFYIQFRDLLAPKLKLIYEEALDNGYMHGTMKNGEVIVLYKKGDPREVRNYRPITLLNLDYKIYNK